MRMANFIEGLLFMIGFLFLCLMILMDRSPQRVPARVAAPARRPNRSSSITS